MTEPAARGESMVRYLRRLVWLSILPLLLLAMVMAGDNLRRLRDADDRSGALLAAQLARQVDEMVRQRTTALEMLSASPLLDDRRLGEFHQRAKVFARQFGSEVLLADDQGRMLVHTGVPFGQTLPPMPRPAGRAALPAALASGRAAAGDLLMGPIAGRPIVAVAVPVMRDGRAELALLSAIEARVFQAPIERAGLAEGWHAALVDSRRTPIAGAFAPGSSASAAEDGGARFEQATALAPWSVVVDQSAASRRGPLLVALLALGTAIAVATAIGRLAGGTGARRLTRAVAGLADGDAAGERTPIEEIEAARRTLRAAGAEREAAIQLLRRSRAQLAALIEQAPHSIAMLDREMRYVATSSMWVRTFAAGRDSVVGLDHYALLPDQPAAWRDVHRRGLAGETVVNADDRWERADGSVHWLSWVVQPWIDDTGAVGGVIISTADVSEQRRMVEALREASERFATLFQSAPVAMVVGGLGDLRFVEVNSAFEALTGHSRAEVLGRTSADFDLWADADFRREAITRLRDEGAMPVTAARMRCRSGEILDVSFSSCRVEIAGRPHFVAMIVDITPLQQARRALERQHEELETLVARRTADLAAANATLAERAAAIAELYDGAPCGYHTLTPDGTVERVNATELAMLGYTRDEFVGRPIWSFKSPASRALFAEHYPRLLATGSIRDVGFEFVRKDGSVLPVLVNAVKVLDAEGRHVSNRAIVVDDSERRQRERQIVAMQLELAQRADEAEAANRAKSAFLANMSHEIRTPMNAILGLTHLMSRDATEPLQRERLSKVEGAGRHLLQVINDILDLSKIEAGKLVLEDTVFELDDLLARVLALVEGPAGAKGLELVVDTDGAPRHLRGDPTRLSQALVNLLSNAVKFTVRGWVRLAVGSLPSDGDGVLLRFEVRDTGEGIAPDALPHLFKAFEQADSSTTRRHGGTGLGLALTRHIAHTMGGEVGVDSEPGVGSRFWFTARLRLADAPAGAVAARAFTGRRALLVDDLPESLAALRDQLRVLGFRVDAFGDAPAALQAATAAFALDGACDLILLDRGTAPTDAAELLARLRRLPGCANAMALLVSPHDDGSLRAEAEATGFDAGLVKPVTVSTLLDTLQRRDRGRGAAERSAPPPGALEALLRARHGGRHVLLAEDNPINREVATELLSSVGLDVAVAENGRQAVEMTLAGGFDLVLMDMQMPELDGLDATRRLRAAGLDALPIVAMTANAFGEDRAACEAAGMNDHLAKPVDPERLYATLLRWLPGSSAPAPGRPAPAASLQERLAMIEGLHVGQALANVGGSMAVLRRVLERFESAYRDGLGPLDGSVAHSFRGACAAVGAYGLHDEVLAYEAVLGQAGAEELRRRADDIGRRLATLLERLRDALRAGDMPP